MIFIKVLCNLGKPKPFSLVSDDGSKWIKLNDHDMYRGLKLNLVSRKFPLVSRFKIVPCINAGSSFDFYAFFMFQLFSVKWLNKEGGGGSFIWCPKKNFYRSSESPENICLKTTLKKITKSG